MEQIQTELIKVKPSKILHWSIYLAMISSMIIMSLFAFWLLYPYKTFTANYQPFEILNDGKELKAGDFLIYRGDLCAHMKGEVQIHRVLTNDILVSFTPRTVLIEKIGCKQYENHTVQLPDNIPDGKYHLEINLTMRVNPIRTETVKLKTEDFMVRNPLLELNHDADIGECLEDLCPALP